MKKRMLATVLILLMLASLLTACQTDGTTKAPDASGNGDTLPQVTLQFWMGCQGKQKDTDEVHAHLQQQIAEHLPNTEIAWTLLTLAEYDE